MTNFHEPVYLRFRGRSRRLPLLAMAAALRRDLPAAADAIEILIQGPPETRPPSSSTELSPGPSQTHGEGEGGGVQEQTQMNLSCGEQEHGWEGGAGEGDERAAFLTVLLERLGPEANPVAISRLVDSHPRALLSEALRRALLVHPENIRHSRSAVFTGIVRKLAHRSLTKP